MVIIQCNNGRPLHDGSYIFCMQACIHMYICSILNHIIKSGCKTSTGDSKRQTNHSDRGNTIFLKQTFLMRDPI